MTTAIGMRVHHEDAGAMELSNIKCPHFDGAVATTAPSMVERYSHQNGAHSQIAMDEPSKCYNANDS